MSKKYQKYLETLTLKELQEEANRQTGLSIKHSKSAVRWAIVSAIAMGIVIVIQILRLFGVIDG